MIYNYEVIDKLIKHHSFLHSVNQRKLAMHITLNVLADYELLFNVDTCDKGHGIEKNTKNVCLELYKCSFK